VIELKLRIKKKFFDRIKKGEKTADYRDAHITFVCEETGETLRKEVNSVDVIPKISLEDEDCYPLFEDESLIQFNLE